MAGIGELAKRRRAMPDLTIMIGVAKPKNSPDKPDKYGDVPEEEEDPDDEDDADDDEDDMVGFGSPEEEDNARIVSSAADALRGRHKAPTEAINEFIEVFGRDELKHLRAMVSPESEEPKALRAATGRLIEGPGRGMEDRIPAAAGDQPVLLSDGEFVIPADVVSMLGDGSTKAGVRVLEAMIERVREMKTGDGEQAEMLDLEEVMPA